jgi:hypothetical protein
MRPPEPAAAHLAGEFLVLALDVMTLPWLLAAEAAVPPS